MRTARSGWSTLTSAWSTKNFINDEPFTSQSLSSCILPSNIHACGADERRFSCIIYDENSLSVPGEGNFRETINLKTGRRGPERIFLPRTRKKIAKEIRNLMRWNPRPISGWAPPVWTRTIIFNYAVSPCVSQVGVGHALKLIFHVLHKNKDACSNNWKTAPTHTGFLAEDAPGSSWTWIYCFHFSQNLSGLFQGLKTFLHLTNSTHEKDEVAFSFVLGDNQGYFKFKKILQVPIKKVYYSKAYVSEKLFVLSKWQIMAYLSE